MKKIDFKSGHASLRPFKRIHSNFWEENELGNLEFNIEKLFQHLDKVRKKTNEELPNNSGWYVWIDEVATSSFRLSDPKTYGMENYPFNGDPKENARFLGKVTFEMRMETNRRIEKVKDFKCRYIGCTSGTSGSSGIRNRHQVDHTNRAYLLVAGVSLVDRRIQDLKELLKKAQDISSTLNEQSNNISKLLDITQIESDKKKLGNTYDAIEKYQASCIAFVHFEKGQLTKSEVLYVESRLIEFFYCKDYLDNANINFEPSDRIYKINILLGEIHFTRDELDKIANEVIDLMCSQLREGSKLPI